MEEIEYPKALYIGDTINNEMVIIQDEDEEAQAREHGAVDFGDLPEGEVIEPVAADELQEAYANAMARIAELETEVRGYQLKDMQSDELKAILTERKIEFGSRDSKATLFNMVTASASSGTIA